MDLRFRKPLLYPAELQDHFKKQMTNYECKITKLNSSFVTLHSSFSILSGWQDSNLRPSAPKADALAGLRYTAIYFLSATNSTFQLYSNCAEREGFEPSVPLSRYGSLANYWFKPLTHLSLYVQGVANLEKISHENVFIPCERKWVVLLLLNDHFLNSFGAVPNSYRFQKIHSVWLS